MGSVEPVGNGALEARGGFVGCGALVGHVASDVRGALVGLGSFDVFAGCGSLGGVVGAGSLEVAGASVGDSWATAGTMNGTLPERRAIIRIVLIKFFILFFTT